MKDHIKVTAMAVFELPDNYTVDELKQELEGNIRDMVVDSSELGRSIVGEPTIQFATLLATDIIQLKAKELVHEAEGCGRTIMIDSDGTVFVGNRGSRKK